MFMEYTLRNNLYPEKNFVQKLRTLFRAGAIRTNTSSYPNFNEGYGILNLRRTFEVFR